MFKEKLIDFFTKKSFRMYLFCYGLDDLYFGQRLESRDGKFLDVIPLTLFLRDRNCYYDLFDHNVCCQLVDEDDEFVGYGCCHLRSVQSLLRKDVRKEKIK